MYYVLECPKKYTKFGQVLYAIHNLDQIVDKPWKTGEPFLFDVPVPISYEFEPLRGYEGLPPEFTDLGTPIMSAKMVKALLGAGVDNIQFYDVILTNKITQEKYSYHAFNIVGLIAAANLEESDWSSFENSTVGSVSFNHLVLDEQKCRGALVFRMAENLGTILVHDTVKRAIENAGIDSVIFHNPEDYVVI